MDNYKQPTWTKTEFTGSKVLSVDLKRHDVIHLVNEERYFLYDGHFFDEVFEKNGSVDIPEPFEKWFLRLPDEVKLRLINRAQQILSVNAGFTVSFKMPVDKTEIDELMLNHSVFKWLEKVEENGGHLSIDKKLTPEAIEDFKEKFKQHIQNPPKL